MNLFQELVSAAEIEKAIEESPEVNAGLIKKAEEVQAYWVEYWNSIDHPESREHTLRSGYVEHPGDYAKSIKVQFIHEHGEKKARVSANDYKMYWIEYGAEHMPEFAPRQATLDHFGGESGTVSA
jgi:hypothetical protein